MNPTLCAVKQRRQKRKLQTMESGSLRPRPPAAAQALGDTYLAGGLGSSGRRRGFSAAWPARPGEAEPAHSLRAPRPQLCTPRDGSGTGAGGGGCSRGREGRGGEEVQQAPAAPPAPRRAATTPRAPRSVERSSPAAAPGAARVFIQEAQARHFLLPIWVALELQVMLF